MRGGRRTEAEKSEGPKCHGDLDPITFEKIPEQYAFRLHKTCWDIGSLYSYIVDYKKNIDPHTSKPFTNEDYIKINKKLKKLGLATIIQGPYFPETFFKMTVYTKTYDNIHTGMIQSALHGPDYSKFVANDKSDKEVSFELYTNEDNSKDCFAIFIIKYTDYNRESKKYKFDILGLFDSGKDSYGTIVRHENYYDYLRFITTGNLIIEINTRGQIIIQKEKTDREEISFKLTWNRDGASFSKLYQEFKKIPEYNIFN